MNDWRSEPPDSAGWWDWERESDSAIFYSLRVEFIAGAYRRLGWGTYELLPLPEGGQWRKVPE